MWFDVRFRYEITKERHRTKLGHGMCILCVIMWIDEWLYVCAMVYGCVFGVYDMLYV